MDAETPYQSWHDVRRHPRHFGAILRHQSRKKRNTVLVAQLHDGMWASSNLHLGTTTGVQKLGLSMAKHIKNLYEVGVSSNSMTFSSVFETEKEGGIVDGTVSVSWQVTDPVALIRQPKFDHFDAIRNAVEDKLRPIVLRTALEEVEQLAEVADRTLAPMVALREGPISWGKGDTLFHLNGMGALHRHALETIRRARIVDREQRAMDQERISFYGEVIDSGKVSLLAMMLSQDKEKVQQVLNYIHTHDIPIGRTLPGIDDPFRNAVSRLMSEADDFDLHEMRMDWLNTVTSRGRESELARLRESLEETFTHEGRNGSGPRTNGSTAY
ncbi:hypothetical protein ABZU76_07360 [Amycolatopsis sp. NPDC005232]|uniref:hypothetical protein n=1 Tax=Amycolatopsis sp. NPDC005232 TaxID=3157027 RepID=UPI0033BA1A73